MLDTETKERFIIMRAENKSYSQIQKELHIGKSTCIELQKELETQIAELKAENLERLYNTYSMTKEARIKALGKTLKKINTALENADFSQVAPEKLLDFKLKYTQQLKEEFTQTAYRIEAPTAETIGEALKDLLERVRNGNTDTQTTKELNIIALMLKNHETLAPSNLENEVEAILNNRYELVPKQEQQEFLNHNEELSELADYINQPP